ncbi:hypothetical protein Hdeb2414_s0023g00637031 [Helianthus debilis subsp. tardiflorus]
MTICVLTKRLPLYGNMYTHEPTLSKYYRIQQQTDGTKKLWRHYAA